MKRLRVTLTVAVAAAAVVALLIAASAFGARAATAATPQRVAVGMTEFKFALKPTAVKKGVVVFRLTNRGAVAHDFRILGKRSPRVGAGRTGSLRVTFTKAGRYAYICTLPTHALAGMKGTLVVR